jgi:CorA-like Mg2+ transporter protein
LSAHPNYLCLPRLAEVGSYHNYEHFAYARHDFHIGRNLVLVLGTNGEISARQLTTQFRGRVHVDLFCILLALTTSWSRQLERHRWRIDCGIVKLESQTGHSGFQFSNSVSLTPQQLYLSRDVTLASVGISVAKMGALNMARNFSFLLAQLERYSTLCAGPPVQQASAQLKILLYDALSQRLSQTHAQIDEMNVLQLRIDTQSNIINALIAQRDSRTNIDIAVATKAESELMRGIALTTMIFLPATFIATFFSMAFFHIGSEDHVQLIISKWVWLYPLCTIPLTVVLVLNYGQYTWLKPLFQASGKYIMMSRRERTDDQEQ